MSFGVHVHVRYTVNLSSVKPKRDRARTLRKTVEPGTFSWLALRTDTCKLFVPRGLERTLKWYLEKF